MDAPSVSEAVRPFASVQRGGGGVYSPSIGRSPIVYLKKVLAYLTPDLAGVVWVDGGHPSRLFAVAGSHVTTYAFRAGSAVKRFRTDSQSDEINRTVMEINQTIVAALRDIQRDPHYALALSPLCPPPHNLATLHKTVRAVEGRALGVHSDDEPHGSPLITSVSFGADALFVMYPFGVNAQPVEVVLSHGDVVFFDRLIPHGVFDVKGERVNITFRTWPDAPWWRPDVGVKRVAQLGNKTNKKARTGEKPRNEGAGSSQKGPQALAHVADAVVKPVGPFQPPPPPPSVRQQKPEYRNWERPQKVVAHGRGAPRRSSPWW